MGIKLHEALQESIVCGDGAMGTELLAAGVALDVCLEELNVSQPDLVSKVHESYVDAGSQLLETNTFGANAIRLAKHGLENEVEAFNQTAVALAKKSVGKRNIWIAGSVVTPAACARLRPSYGCAGIVREPSTPLAAERPPLAFGLVTLALFKRSKRRFRPRGNHVGLQFSDARHLA